MDTCVECGNDAATEGQAECMDCLAPFTLAGLSDAQHELATQEARGWLMDCGMSAAHASYLRSEDAWSLVARNYGGGISAFLSDTYALWGE